MQLETMQLTEAQKGRFSLLWFKIRRNAGLYFLILPALVYIIIFNFIPMYGILIAFQNFKPFLGVAGSDWVGLHHFKRFFGLNAFGSLMKNTLTLSLYGLVAGLPMPVLLALLLNMCISKRLKKIVQVVTYAPHFISTVVFVGIINVFFSPSLGIVKTILNTVGLLDGPLMTLLNPDAFPHLYVWSGVWQGMGWGSIIYLAALTGIDVEIQEAAYVEGATKLQQVWYIDLPTIIPTIVTMLILSCGSILNVGFEKVFLMQNTLNLQTSEIISTYVYKVGILDTQYSYSAAIGIFNSVINLALLISVDRISKAMGQRGLF